MDDPRKWRTLAGLAAIWTGFAVVWGGPGAAAAPGAICVLLLVCAANSGLRRRLMDNALRAVSSSSLRTAIILAGAILLWQVVGVELALLAAGEVLAYLELLAAVGLVAANARFKPLNTQVARRLDQWRRGTAIRLGRASRAIRTLRPPRFGSPPADDEHPAGALAFA